MSLAMVGSSQNSLFVNPTTAPESVMILFRVSVVYAEWRLLGGHTGTVVVCALCCVVLYVRMCMHLCIHTLKFINTQRYTSKY